jgi:signal transduction histidine kinase
VGGYSAGSSRKWVPRAGVAGRPYAYARRMRTDRGRRMLYAAGAAGWVIVMVVTSRMWQLHVREVEQRAEEAERTKDEAARRRAMEERLRIARELHDSLTHSISVISVQAGVAAHLARKRGEDVPPSLLAIQEAGADALRELRTTLSVLRSEEDGDGSGLGQLDGLVGRASAAGLPVTVTVTGAEWALPPEVDQAAYRIVQEALTNVSRHAGRACASVHLHYTPDALSVQVDDDGTGTGTSPGPRPAGPGLGLIGMRERVTALGGRLHAGPREGGGFQVRAEFPARAPS